jgi:hypothetical protein
MPIDKVINTHQLQVEEAKQLVLLHLQYWKEELKEQNLLSPRTIADQLFALSGLEVVIPYVPPENVICVVSVVRKRGKVRKNTTDVKLNKTTFQLLKKTVVWNENYSGKKKKEVGLEIDKFSMDFQPVQSVRRMIKEKVNNIKEIIESVKIDINNIEESKFRCECSWCTHENFSQAKKIDPKKSQILKDLSEKK